MNQAVKILDRPLPYSGRLEARDMGAVDMVVVHCTELPDLVMAREYGERIHYPASGTGNSGHFYIDRDGRIESWVAIDRVANHTRGFNPRSIGIELVNLGRYPNWFSSHSQDMHEAYPDVQTGALAGLLLMLSSRHPSLRFIAGHEDLDLDLVPAEDDPGTMVRRKTDPGPKFPWPEVLAAIPLERYYPDRPG